MSSIYNTMYVVIIIHCRRPKWTLKMSLSRTIGRMHLTAFSRISLNSTGPTPTPTRTLGMRLSCNFVNVYRIVYHVQYTYTCTRAHPQRTSSRGKARVGQKSANKNGPRAPRQADCRARILAPKSARKSVSVSVSVSVPWNLSYIA